MGLRRELARPDGAFLERCRAIVGPDHVLTDADAQAPYITEWRGLYRALAAAVVRPKTVAEVAAVVALANEARVAVVPQGGNTGLVGGQVPGEPGREIVLSLARLDRVRAIDAEATTVTVEAGVTLQRVHEIAAELDRLFPLSMASEGSATIGGNLATNAGGTGVLAHGTARQQVLGIEAVLADGRVWNGLSALRKDNTGYDLRDLLIGSEGTLGVITAAVLRLLPAPRERSTALVAVAETSALPRLYRLASQRAGGLLTAFEFMSATAVDFVLRHGTRVNMPLAEKAPWYVLMEVSCGVEALAEPLMEDILTAATINGLITDGTLAQSLDQARVLWRIREEISAAQKPEGGSIKHDVSLPVAQLVEFLGCAAEVVERIAPGARPVPFGHFGDGNVHYNISQPPDADREAFLALWPTMADAVHELVAELGGSISAEHGIGQLKRGDLVRHKPEVALDLMRRIKDALDPNGILNPGKVL